MKRTAKSKVDLVLRSKGRESGASNILTKRTDAPTDQTSGRSIRELQPMNLLRMEAEAASQLGTFPSQNMDSILGGDPSSPHMRIFGGDVAISHLQHTQNSKQTSSSALQAVAEQMNTGTSPS